jgi:hypothetical protein
MGSLRTLKTDAAMEDFNHSFLSETQTYSIRVRSVAKSFTGRFEVRYELLHPIAAGTVMIEILDGPKGSRKLAIIDDGHGILYGSKVRGIIDYFTGHVYLNFTNVYVSEDDWIVTTYQQKYRKRRQEKWVASEL